VQNFVERVEKSSMLLLDSVISRGLKGVGSQLEGARESGSKYVAGKKVNGDEHGKLSTRHVGHKSAGDSEGMPVGGGTCGSRLCLRLSFTWSRGV